MEIKRSLHELLGWVFALSTRLAPPLFKIARLIVGWRYEAASIYIEIDIIFIFLQKIFKSLSSIAENLIIALTIGKTMCICEIYFSENGFYLAHFHEDIQKFHILSDSKQVQLRTNEIIWWQYGNC